MISRMEVFLIAFIKYHWYKVYNFIARRKVSQPKPIDDSSDTLLEGKANVTCPKCLGSGDRVISRSNHFSVFTTRKCALCLGTKEVTQQQADEYALRQSKTSS